MMAVAEAVVRDATMVDDDDVIIAVLATSVDASANE